MGRAQYELREIPGDFVVVRFCPPLDFHILGEILAQNDFSSVSVSSDEISVVCNRNCLRLLDSQPHVTSEGWSCFGLIGPIPFNQVGVIFDIVAPIARIDIGCFVVSTFDTDYVLVKSTDVSAVQAAWHSSHISIRK